MSTVLITGTNKGLGYEIARQLVAAGHTVYAGARDVERGRKAAHELGARFVQLDVTDASSVSTSWTKRAPSSWAVLRPRSTSRAPA